MKKYIVTLTEGERKTLGALTSKGKHKSQKIINSLILLGCDEGEFQKERGLLKKALMLPSTAGKEVASTQKKRTEILKPIWLH